MKRTMDIPDTLELVPGGNLRLDAPLVLAPNETIIFRCEEGAFVPTEYYYRSALQRIQADPRYLRNLDWGAPRPGHPEGTVRAHIEEVAANLAALRYELGETDYARLLIVAHVHDTFKAEALRGVPILHPQSHASLARAFLAGFCGDTELLNIVQFHDEPFALWRQVRAKGTYDRARMDALRAAIRNDRLLLAFLAADNATGDKSGESLAWFREEWRHEQPEEPS